MFRNISVALTGNASGLNSVLRQAASEVDRFGTTVERVNQRAGGSQDQTTAAAVRSGDAFRDLSLVAAASGAAVAAGLSVAVRSFAQFDKSLSGVEAVANASAREMGALRQAALDAGAATVFSASEAAAAEAELAKAGVSVDDILGGALRGSLDLAAAGQLELADAATIAAQAMNIFKLQGSQVSRIADVLAAGANKSAADVYQLGEALRQGGLVAAQTGLTLEETVAGLSAFADSALIGSDAGTSFKTALQRLLPQSKEAGDAMEAIGFNAFDAQGNFVGLAEVAGQLQAGLGQLTAEQRAATLQSIFGADAIRAANVLYEEGEQGIRDYIDAVVDQGAAQRMAQTQLDNLIGDLEAFKGSVETALIGSGSGANDALRGLTQSATGAVNAFAGLPEPVQQSAFWVGATASAGLLAAGAFGTLAPKVETTRQALRGLGTAGAFADANLGRLARVGGYAAAIAALTGALDFLIDKMDEFQGVQPPDVDRLTNSLLKFARTGTVGGEAARVLGEDLESLRKALNALDDTNADFVAGKGLNVEAFDRFDERIQGLDRTLAGLVDQGYGDTARRVFGALAEGADLSSGQVERLRKALPEYRLALRNADTAAQLADESSSQVGVTLGNEVAPAAEEAAEAVEQYVNALQDTAEIDAYTATAELAQSFRELTKELKDGERVTNDEKIALGGFARSVLSAAEAIYEQSGSQQQANRHVREGRDRFADLAEQAGYTADEARELAEQLLRIPRRTDVDINSDGVSEASRQVQRLAERLFRLDGADVSVTVGAYNRARAAGFAGGGQVVGEGTSTSDSILARLSAGEHVWTALEVAAVGGHRAMERMRRQALAGQLAPLPRFATGGAVMPRHAPAPVVNVTAPPAAGRQAPLVGQIVANYPAPARMGDTVQLELAAVAHSYGLDLES